MPMLIGPNNPSNPEGWPQGCLPLPPPQYWDPKSPTAWDYGFKRFMPFLQAPPVSAGIIAITFFFLILFFSNVLLYKISSATLGITVTLGTLGLLALLVLLLFIF